MKTNPQTHPYAKTLATWANNPRDYKWQERFWKGNAGKWTDWYDIDTEDALCNMGNFNTPDVYTLNEWRIVPNVYRIEDPIIPDGWTIERVSSRMYTIKNLELNIDEIVMDNDSGHLEVFIFKLLQKMDT